jgi:hypothetical protein
MDAEQQPGPVGGGAGFGRAAHDDGSAAGAAVGAGVGEEVALPLEAQAERGGDDGLPDDGQAVQAVVKAEREADDQQRARG